MYISKIDELIDRILMDRVRASAFFKMQQFAKEAQKAYDEVISNFDDYEFERDRASYSIAIVLSGSYGLSDMAVEEVAEALGIDLSEFDSEDPEYRDFLIEEIESILQKDIIPDIEKSIKIKTVSGYDYSFSYNWDDNTLTVDIIIEKE